MGPTAEDLLDDLESIFREAYEEIALLPYSSSIESVLLKIANKLDNLRVLYAKQL